MKQFPLTLETVKSITKDYQTPFHLYDEKAILENGNAFNNAFNWVPTGFKNYFAVKAMPNPYMLKILARECGMGADCSSLPELILAERVGLKGDEIMFSSNNTAINEFRKALELDAIVNLDDITHFDMLDQLGFPKKICFRYNPGPLKEGNTIIGKPEEAKYGFTREQIIEGYKMAKERGVERFGLHTMVASNELNGDYFVETAKILFELAVEIEQKTGVKLEFVNLGGGIGIPYTLEQKAVDFEEVSEGIKKEYERIIKPTGLDPLKVVFECGRVITGPYGYLVTKAINSKDTYKKYIGVDACMTDLMRPGVYGAYHHITVLGKEDAELTETYDVTGSLCENNDKFAIDRKLPPIDKDDFVIIHDTGAHGYAMGFNYNGKLKHTELLLREDSTVFMIRRAETVVDYFSTIDFKKLDRI